MWCGKPKFLLLLVFTVLFSVFSSSFVEASAISGYVARDNDGKYYEYQYEELLDSYTFKILGASAKLFNDFNSKNMAAYNSSKGYFDYEDILDAYTIAILSNKSFNLKNYIESGKAKPVNFQAIVQVTLEDGKLKEIEKIIKEDVLNEIIQSVNPNLSNPQLAGTTVRWQAITLENEEIQFSWDVYRDEELITSKDFNENNYIEVNLDKPGVYQVEVNIKTSDEVEESMSSAQFKVIEVMEILTPELEWNESPLRLYTQPVERLIQHHMAHPTWDFYEVHEYHKTKTYINDDGEKDYWSGIGYNYWIGFDGSIYQGRGEYVGGHAGKYWNEISIGIGFQGDFTSQEMTDEQVKSGAWLNAKFIMEHDLKVSDVVGHGDVGSTACPGKYFRWNDLKDEINKLLY